MTKKTEAEMLAILKETNEVLSSLGLLASDYAKERYGERAQALLARVREAVGQDDGLDEMSRDAFVDKWARKACDETEGCKGHAKVLAQMRDEIGKDLARVEAKVVNKIAEWILSLNMDTFSQQEIADGVWEGEWDK